MLHTLSQRFLAYSEPPQLGLSSSTIMIIHTGLAGGLDLKGHVRSNKNAKLAESG